eukprot:GHVT01088655.1.p1 GENE.GHVT01088655.1~~GHVT01088655.1.p1  ORF type:complete len:193 (-),score=12.48 GHVT01088655.1:40-618(-)
MADDRGTEPLLAVIQHSAPLVATDECPSGGPASGYYAETVGPSRGIRRGLSRSLLGSYRRPREGSGPRRRHSISGPLLNGQAFLQSLGVLPQSVTRCITGPRFAVIPPTEAESARLYDAWKWTGLRQMFGDHPRDNQGFCFFVFVCFVLLEVFINYDCGAIPASLSIISSEFNLSSTWQGSLAVRNDHSSPR